MIEDQNKANSIKNWSADDRPREKMISNGRQSLSDSELLAIILGSGSRGESAVELSKRILADHQNNLNELGKITIKDLTNRYKGIGEAKAINIIAALELGRRRQSNEAVERISIISSRDAYNILHPVLSDLPYEEFWIILTNRANKVIFKTLISRGGIHAVIVDVRLIVKCALEHLACGIILGHNHPSSSLRPSKADIDITAQIKQAAGFFNINVNDHIIVGDLDYYSFADNGQM
jgi:DNA repair protein RadC